MKIIPAILETDFEKVKSYIYTFSKVTTEIQIDICDGKFVNAITWLPNSYDELNGLNINIEFDMMVTDVEKYLNNIFYYDAKKIIVHTRDIDIEKYKEIYKYIKSKNSLIKVGICDKNIEKIKEAFMYFDYVQIMGIKNVGFQGQDFDNDVLYFIKDLREFLNKKKEELHLEKDIIIQIDGAMNPETINKCKEFGANSFVVGSYLKKGIQENKLKELFNEIMNLQ